MTTTLFRYEGEGLLKKRVPVEINKQEIDEKIFAEQIKLGERVVQELLDSKAGEHGYKLDGKPSILSACSYAGYDNPFRKEAEQFLAWRGANWGFLYQYVENIKQGTEPMPESFDDVIKLLPKFEDFKN